VSNLVYRLDTPTFYTTGNINQQGKKPTLEMNEFIYEINEFIYEIEFNPLFAI